MYKISKYSKQQAKLLGVEIYPSEYKNKKIDIYKNEEFLFSIGDNRYLDYTSYLEYGKDIADKHRKNYYIRHAKDIKKVGSKGWWAAKLLWPIL
jgi:hypothetical protein